MKEESTGQQQPEGDTESAAIAWALKYEKEYEKQYYVNTYDLRMAFRAGASYVESLTRWRDISKEGLPGEGDPEERFLLLNVYELKVRFKKRRFMQFYPDHVSKDYTHWRPIELPHL